MSRQDNRAATRENQKNVKIYKTLNPSQIKFIDNLTEHKALKMVNEFMAIFDEEAYKVLRNSHVGKLHAIQILTDISINLKSQGGK